MDNTTDSELVDLIKSGNQDVFIELQKKYQSAVHGYAYYLSQNDSAAEDITQETFIAAYYNLHALRDSRNLRAWLRSITYRKSMDWIRQNQIYKPLKNDIPENRQNVIDILENKEVLELLSYLVKRLSEPNRIVVTLKLEGLKNREIADFLELPQNAVDNRLRRARNQLQENIMKALERGHPRLDEDFAGITYRKIQYYRPVIAVELHFLDRHRDDGCACISNAKSLSEQIGGVFHRLTNKGVEIYYGKDQTREDDVNRAMEMARKLHQKKCPAGPFFLSVRQINSNLTGKVSSLWNFPHDGSIYADGSVAWMLREEFRFGEVQQTDVNDAVYRLIADPLPETVEKDIFVGRNAEFHQLEELVQHLLLGGSGIVQLTGEAGIGKTHLLDALQRKFKDENLIWLEGKTNQSQPLFPVREALKSYFSFSSARKLRDHLISHGLEELFPYLAHLLQLLFKSSDRRYNSLTIERINYHSYRCLHDWLKHLSAEKPIVFVVEDTQWLDEESSKSLQYISRLTKNSPVLFIFSRRSGYEQIEERAYGLELEELLSKSYSRMYNNIHLEPLSDKESLILLSHMLMPKKLMPGNLERALKSASGNPLYLREVSQFIMTSKDEGIPPGIERLILAHLDLLSSIHQAILHYISVMGDSIHTPIITAAFPEVDLSPHLKELEQMGWIRSNTESKETVFAWQHDLYGEVIYKGIESESKRIIHAEVARHLEETPEIEPHILAEHYDKADITEKSVAYACLAVKKYIDEELYRRVPKYADIAMSHLDIMSDEQKYEICYMYALALLRSGRSPETIAYWEKALSYADTKEKQIDVYLSWAKCAPAEAVKMREYVLDMIDEHTERSIVVKVLKDLSGGRRMPDLNHFDRLLHFIRDKADIELESLLFKAMATFMVNIEEFGPAQVNIQQAIHLIEMVGDDELIGEMEAAAGHIFIQSFQWQEAMHHLKRALSLLEKAGANTWPIWGMMGGAYRKSGDYKSMIYALEQVLRHRELVIDAWDFSMEILPRLIQGYAYLGDWEKAYGYFWQMMDGVEPFSKDSFNAGEDAVAALCHGDKIDQRWTYEDIPGTIKRARELIDVLYQHNITQEDMKRLKLVNPIIAAAYVEYGITDSYEDAVDMLRLFIPKALVVDEIVGFWAYLCQNLDRVKLETALSAALKHADTIEGMSQEEIKPTFLNHANPEKPTLEWMQAALKERYEEENKGRFLIELGFIPEPCWLVTGLYEEDIPAEKEQDILESVFSLSKNYDLWRKPNDNVDGYIDFRYIFQTMENKSGYAVTDIEAPEEKLVKFSVFVDDKICIWINGEKRYERSHSGFGEFGSVLKSGCNRILIRLTNYSEGWGFMLRVTDEKDKPLPSLTFSDPE